MTAPRVLFVSKPIAPPWHDGSKNLVRDLATHLRRAEPTVLTPPGSPTLGPRVKMDPIYVTSGSFAPGMAANARVLARLLTGDPLDIWHFAFAPNAASSSAAKMAKGTRRAFGWKGGVVQTIASAPREFEGINRWIFGDRVVALSEWTRGRLMAYGVDANLISVIPPCAKAPEAPSAERRAAVRAQLGVDGPVLLYPGDYEVSHGASTVADAAEDILRALPDATIVFACRPKTVRAQAARASIEASLERAGLSARARHVGEVTDMPALLAESLLVLFPVDDLYGKVDVPLVLLEAMALGLPLILARGGPLEAITTAKFVEPTDSAGLARAAISLARSEFDQSEQRDAGRALFESTFTPSVVAAAHDDLYDQLMKSRRH